MSFPIPAQSALLARQGINARWMIYMVARARDGAGSQALGIWDAAYDAELAPEGDARLYLGTPGLFDVKPITYATGTQIRSQSVTMSIGNPAVETIIRGFDVRFAPVELHLAIYDGPGVNLLGISRRFKGTIDGAPISFGASGGGATATFKMVSTSRNGTQNAAARKSDEQQSLRQSDSFRQYAAVSAVVADWWGSKQENKKTFKQLYSKATGK